MRGRRHGRPNSARNRPRSGLMKERADRRAGDRVRGLRGAYAAMMRGCYNDGNERREPQRRGHARAGRHPHRRGQQPQRPRRVRRKNKSSARARSRPRRLPAMARARSGLSDHHAPKHRRAQTRAGVTSPWTRAHRVRDDGSQQRPSQRERSSSVPPRRRPHRSGRARRSIRFPVT